MYQDLYSSVTFAQIIVLVVLGIVLLNFRIRVEKKTFNLRLAKGFLALSYFMLAVPAFIEYFFDGGFNRMWVEIFTPPGASIQSMFFTFTFLTILQPISMSRKQILLHAALIFGVIILYLLAAFNLQQYHWVIYIFLAAYFCQLVFYVRLFKKKYAVSIKQLEDYYDEDEQGRLRWVKISFYAALSLGIIASVSAYFPFKFYVVFVMIYIIFYAWFAIRFINFLSNFDFYLSATAREPEQIPSESEILVDMDAEREKQLKKSLEQWVVDGGYTRGDISTEEIAKVLGTDLLFLRSYFRNNMPCDFRTWRNELRIRKAQEVISENPEISINQIAQQVGFVTQSNFYLYFKKITGCSPTDFRDNKAVRK
jgi:AraC-like DNA-binding protein